MAGNNEFATEGASLVRPPGFTREDYPYQRDKFKMYVKSTQYQLQSIIQNGDIPITKLEDDYGPNEYATLEKNTKARFMITSSLTKSLFYKFKNHDNAKDLWKAFQITYEGTDDVKLRKAATLQRQYKMFAMMDGGSIDDMHGRFQVIVMSFLPWELSSQTLKTI